MSSTVPDTARFEIIPANVKGWNSALTLRLDKYTGRIFQIKGCPQKTFVGTGLCWTEMTILDLPRNSSDGVPRYQIFVSGDGKHIFLINIINGQTWQHGVEAADRWTPLLDTVVLPQSFEIVR